MMDTKKYDQISVTDASNFHGSVRRCRDTEATNSGSGKRRKFDLQDHENVVQPKNHSRGGVDVNSREDVVSTTETGTCDHVVSSTCCLSLDLKTELRSDTETFKSGDGGFSRETSASSEICSDSDKMNTLSTMNKQPAPPRAVTSCQKQVAKYPTAAEIDEFFSVAEKKEQRRFSDKYNFDIVNEVPLVGRYQWVRLKP